jgi:leucyl aminopeptidase
MEYFSEVRAAARVRTECAVVGVHDDRTLPGSADDLDAALGGRLARVLKAGDFAGRLGETMLMPDVGLATAARVLLVGLGPKKAWGRRNFKRAAVAAAQALTKSAAKDAVFWLTADAVPGVDAYYRARLVAEAIGHALYRIPDLKSARKPPAPKLARVGLRADKADAASVARGAEHGRGIAIGTAVTRDLANLPANVCTPSYLGSYAKRLAREHRSVRVRVLAEPEIKRLGMGSFLSVTAGSDEPARLIVLEYRGGGGDAPVALVGKGITFDTGGISLKDPPGMDEMKFDMTGAATVFGAIKALAELDAPINAVGIVPACENMPSGRATKPGDIVTSMSGQTIEVLNTDAEGRLVLCDAMSYARRFKPDVVIDIATLTGACVIALGAHVTGVWSNDDELANGLLEAGTRAADGAWRMPLMEEYQEQLKSNFADFANVGGREGGACTAAGFLWKFADGLRWAHLDIAGTAYVGGANKGSTGRPVPMLVDYLLSRA